MAAHAILYPVFVQIALTFALGIWTAKLRYQATANRDVKVRDIILHQPAWPERITKIGNCFRNQFEGPILLYALIPLLLVTGMVDMASLVMAWIFVAARLVHAFIHTGSNALARRFVAYIAGTATLLCMWIWFAIRIIGGL